MTIKITVIGTPPLEFSKRIDKAIKNAELALQEFGEVTAEYMRTSITNNTKRQPASGNLANSIQSHLTTNGVGIGRIASLPIYWHVINYGKKMSGEAFLPGAGKTVRGDFGGARPDAGAQGIEGGYGHTMSHPGAFGVKAFKYITPKNYIGKTVSFIKSSWATFMKSRI